MTDAPDAEAAKAFKEEFGCELRHLRLTAGLTQEALARKAGYHRVSITQVEKGRQDFSRQFAECLDMALDAHGELLAIYERLSLSRLRQHTSHESAAVNRMLTHSDTESWDMNRRQLLFQTAMLGAATTLPVVAELRKILLGQQGFLQHRRLGDRNPDLCALGRSVRIAWRLRQEARYVELGRELPNLIASLDAAVQAGEGQAASARVLLVHAYNAASSVLKKLGDPALAAIAADRAVQIARAQGDPLLAAAAAYRLANVFLLARRFEETCDIALSAANMLEPSVDCSQAQLATWGALLLTAAVAAAGQHDTSAAWELIGEAKAATRRLGMEHVGIHAIFGPTTTAIHAVEVAAELGDSSGVLRRSQSVDLARLPGGLLERRSHFLINVARGHGQQADDREAVATLLQAERLAPEEVHVNGSVHGLLRELLDRERRGATPGLRELATRAGVAASA